jgi:hypothetical protein
MKSRSVQVSKINKNSERVFEKYYQKEGFVHVFAKVKDPQINGKEKRDDLKCAINLNLNWRYLRILFSDITRLECLKYSMVGGTESTKNIFGAEFKEELQKIKLSLL